MTTKFQKFESVAIVIALLAIYQELQFSWLWCMLLILTPDIFMLGYLKNPKIGAIVYNIGHSYFTPVLLWFLSHHLRSPLWIAFAIIWALHIAADRMLGFGLKHPNGFKNTHLS